MGDPNYKFTQETFPVIFTDGSYTQLAVMHAERLSDVPAQNNNVCIGRRVFRVHSRCIYYHAVETGIDRTTIERAEVELRQD
jgi:hypothetical protein